MCIYVLASEAEGWPDLARGECGPQKFSGSGAMVPPWGSLVDSRLASEGDFAPQGKFGKV